MQGGMILPEHHSFPDDLMCRECFYRALCAQAAVALCAADLLLPSVPADECCGCRKKAEHMHSLYGMHFCRDCYDRLKKSLEEAHIHL